MLTIGKRVVIVHLPLQVKSLIGIHRCRTYPPIRHDDLRKCRRVIQWLIEKAVSITDVRLADITINLRCIRVLRTVGDAILILIANTRQSRETKLTNRLPVK